MAPALCAAPSPATSAIIFGASISSLYQTPGKVQPEGLPKLQLEDDSTLGRVAYSLPAEHDDHLFRYLFQDAPQGKPTTNNRHVKHNVTFTNMRASAQTFSIKQQGFELHKIKVPGGIDWENPDEVQSKYYPIVEALLKDVTGGSRVHCFEAAVRTGKVEASSVLQKSSTRGEPLPHCHVDFSEEGAKLRLEQIMPEEAAELKKKPFAVVQVWRPLAGPVKSSPLALVDASSASPSDLMINRLFFPQRMQETYHLKHNPNHRWYYAKDMMPDEAYVFVNFDSRADRARFTPHAAFQDLTVGPNAAPRESVEARAFVFWD